MWQLFRTKTDKLFHGVNLKYFVVFWLLICGACGGGQTKAAQQGRAMHEAAAASVAADSAANPAEHELTDTIAASHVGAENWDAVLAALRGQRVACVVNHTSLSAGGHLVDRLLESGVEVRRVFAPEHGFRGAASDGEKVANSVDPRTGLPIISLYGKTKRPTRDMLADVDVVLFDIQDVGLRFYTYISTMHYVMDAAAELGKAVVVLDRPNPNGQLVDGPVLDPAFQSFIGMHSIPVAHGMTVGELAQMINGEGWLSGQRKVELRVVPVRDYRVGQVYVLPVKPSPNLPTQNSIYRYATLCFFEGTVASVGRGTDFPFEVVGHPTYEPRHFSFTPESRPGATYAPLKGQQCWGMDLRAAATAAPPDSIDWGLLREVQTSVRVRPFIDRPQHFDALAGSARLREWLMSERRVASFRESYRDELAQFLRQRQRYLLYERVD